MSTTRDPLYLLLRDPRFLELVSEGTEDSDRMTFASEKLTFDFIKKELGQILGLASFGPGQPNNDTVLWDKQLEGGYGKVVQIAPTNEHPVPFVKDGITHENWTDCKLAVKVIKVNPNVPEYRQCARFVRESIACSKLEHRNITPLIGLWCGFNDNYSLLPSLVSPWIEGGNLYHYINEDSATHVQNQTGKHTPIKTRLFFLHEVMLALQYMHNQEIQVVHGDVRTHNILIQDRHASVCDFGLSRIVGPISGLTSSSMTNERWLAPERINMYKATDKSDVYEFAVTFWNVVTGLIPMKLLEKLTRKKELSRPAGMPEDVWLFLDRCLDHNPSKRMDSTTAELELRNFVEREIDWPVPSY